MTSTERDALFARVFATPDGKTLLGDLAERREQIVTVPEISQRVARARASWATGAKAS